MNTHQTLFRIGFRRRKDIMTWVLSMALWFATSAIDANAAHIDIVALGASNTAGYGVGSNAAFPALIEAALRARGYDVTVTNAGVSGETSAQILSRVDSAVPPGTKVVILQIFTHNDGRYGVSPSETQANTNAAVARIRARGAKVILAGANITASIPRTYYQSDGIHLSAEGHALLAGKLLPQVIGAIGKAR